MKRENSFTIAFMNSKENICIIAGTVLELCHYIQIDTLMYLQNPN